MQEMELRDGDGPECSDLGKVQIPRTIERRSTYNQSDFDFNPHEVIKPLLVKYKSTNFKALLKGYEREIKKRPYPVCTREMESYIVKAAVEYSKDRAAFTQLCRDLITLTQQAQKASGSSLKDPNQTVDIMAYYDELWAEVCEKSQNLPVSEGSEALLAKLTCPSWLLSRLGRDIENISLERAQGYPGDFATVECRTQGRIEMAFWIYISG
ncbi:unnamed protein product [Clonostachys chloroleuca]|uniref:Uncharacterized protein n=1 Tax=Clonostachys chloroleuca TaxID=1926264 RepID=A0AA35VRS8_9HYPO|nr:unnamed protein product [Clonostachys chloroleuca]CAI6090692.1 unnamed protein product [Clonostachys chloroleuca]CAI6090982.1 unnamed protein product [Clonostachys chloroleuca]CAI6099464.1 unnamed protein product [Clonostachys chloroleuca]